MIGSAELSGLDQSAARRYRPARAINVPIELLGIAYFVLLVTVGVILVWQPARMTQVNAIASQLQKDLQDLRLRNEDLKKTVAKLESLSFVEKEAKERLGMVVPTEVRTCPVSQNVSLAAFDAEQNTSADKRESTGIRSLIARITGIFGTKEVTAGTER